MNNSQNDIAVMLKNDKVSVVILCAIMLGNDKNAASIDDNQCIIRFYEGQYFKGDYWTFNSHGEWTNTKNSRLKVPYRHFHAKSIRSFCSTLCRWQICPANSRKYSNLSRRKKCKVISGDQGVESIRSLGWSNFVLGSVRKISGKPNRYLNRRNKKPKRNSTAVSTTSTATSNIPINNIPIIHNGIKRDGTDNIESSVSDLFIVSSLLTTFKGKKIIKCKTNQSPTLI